MANSIAASLDDPKKKSFKAQNQLLLAALDAEIAHRKANAEKRPAGAQETGQNPSQAAPGDVKAGKQGASTPKPISDSAWAEYILFWENDWFDLYAVTKEAFKVNSGHEVLATQRQDFYAQMNEAIVKATPQK